MSRLKRIAVAMGVTGLLSIPVIPAVLAGGGGDDKGGKTAICHATHSEKNPYVLIKVGGKGADAHLEKHGTDSKRADKLGREDFEVTEEDAEDGGEEVTEDGGEEVTEDGATCPPEPEEPEETPAEPEETPAE